MLFAFKNLYKRRSVGERNVVAEKYVSRSRKLLNLTPLISLNVRTYKYELEGSFDLQLGIEEKNAVRAALDSNWITTGPRIAEFEKNFADIIGHDVEAVAVSSANGCTSSLPGNGYWPRGW